jgi:hypothetical protein
MECSFYAKAGAFGGCKTRRLSPIFAVIPDGSAEDLDEDGTI